MLPPDTMAARNFGRNRRRSASSTIAPTVDEPDLAEPNAENRYRVTSADMPLSCPMPNMHLWNSHPRVYLPIEPGSEAKCPYCGAVYILK